MSNFLFENIKRKVFKILRTYTGIRLILMKQSDQELLNVCTSFHNVTCTLIATLMAICKRAWVKSALSKLQYDRLAPDRFAFLNMAYLRDYGNIGYLHLRKF